jgi:NAD-dependent SIR2 family protein deacetylase
MAKNVFILGAGASKEAGAPLMAEFLDVARDLLTSGKVEELHDKESFQQVFEAIRQFRTIHYKSYIDLDNIEAVFGAFEMARLLKGSVNYSAEDVENIIKSIKTLISKTIELTMKYPLKGARILASNTYASFAELVEKLGSESSKYASSVLTFNYDLGLDVAFYCHRVKVDYALPADDDRGTFKLLKLHGSLNWGKCSTEGCGSIVPWHLNQFFEKYRYDAWSGEVRTVVLDVASKLVNHKHKNCNTILNPEPVLVPPTWNKTEYHGALREVWAQAGKELSEAENIIVIGYSHPVSDSFFRYLFALGSVGEANIKRFWVFDPAEGNEVENRFKELIGTGIDKRFRMFKKPFSEAIGIIEEALYKAK